jgi:signal transduction histidine kinase
MPPSTPDAPRARSLNLGRPATWRSLTLGLALACGAAVAGAALPPDTEPAPVHLRQAEFTAGAVLSGSTPTGSTVALPDTWGLRDLKTQGEARYRLRFDLAQLPAQPWGLSFTRISTSHRVFLNGVLVQGENPSGRHHPAPDMIDLPAQLLRLGANEIDIDVRYRVRGGLSAAELGPAATLRAQADHAAVWDRELPRSLNIGMAIVAALMLLIRWLRPVETTIALFGALALLGSLRNYTYFADVSLLPSGATDWLFYAAQIWTAALFVAFALSLNPGARPRWVRPLLIGTAIALPLLGALLMPLGLLPLLRTFTYPVLLLLGGTAVWLMWRGMRQQRDNTSLALVASFGTVVAAGLHDYLFQQGHLALTGTFWMPFVMPFALGLYALVLLKRFVGAIGQVEALRDELEDRVAQRTRALESAVATKSRFLAAASHDLRQPAVAIGLMIGMVRERVLGADVRPLIERAHQAVHALETLLQGLLDLSRLDSGTLQPRRVVLSLQAAFDAIQSHEAEAAASKGLRLRFRAHGLAVFCDPLLLDQMLRNLVANALRYTERGGVLVVARARGREQVLIQVWDSGVGIAAEHQAEVFEEFVQLNSPARESQRGLGLGLALVKRCAGLLGTTIALRSRPGRGSVFSVSLPRLERRAAPRPAQAAAPEPLAGRRILVVDDDASVRGALVARLQAWGAQVWAFDGLPGLHSWLGQDQLHPDMLLTDHQLPEGSGLLVIEALRKRHGAVPALLVTGNTGPDDIARLAGAGVPVLHKPFRAEALLAAIEKALRSA